MKVPEYIVTLCVAADTDPSGWDWESLMDTGEHIVAPVVVAPAFREWELKDGQPPKRVDYVADPKGLLGQWVTVSWNNGTGLMSESGTLLVVHDKDDNAAWENSNCLHVSPSTGTTRIIPRTNIKSITPGRKPSK